MYKRDRSYSPASFSVFLNLSFNSKLTQMHNCAMSKYEVYRLSGARNVTFRANNLLQQIRVQSQNKFEIYSFSRKRKTNKSYACAHCFERFLTSLCPHYVPINQSIFPFIEKPCINPSSATYLFFSLVTIQ